MIGTLAGGGAIVGESNTVGGSSSLEPLGVIEGATRVEDGLDIGDLDTSGSKLAEVSRAGAIKGTRGGGGGGSKTPEVTEREGKS